MNTTIRLCFALLALSTIVTATATATGRQQEPCPDPCDKSRSPCEPDETCIRERVECIRAPCCEAASCEITAYPGR